MKDLDHHTGLTTALRRLSASGAHVPLVPSEARFSRPGWVRGVEGSGQRDPRDLSSLPAGVRISNRHSCRLETTLSPCVPTKLVLLIVTQMPLFSAQTPPPKQRRLASLSAPATNRSPRAAASRIMSARRNR